MSEELGPRFWSKVNKTETCWLWTANTKEWGHGQFMVRRSSRRAHRLAFEEAYGPIPKGMWVLHRCNVAACVRPDHLYLGTHLDNMADMVACGHSHKGERSPIARLTVVDVLAIRGMWYSGMYTQYQIADRYSITQSHVSRLASREAWSHL